MFVCVCACVHIGRSKYVGTKKILITVLVPCYVLLMSENADKNVALPCSFWYCPECILNAV